MIGRLLAAMLAIAGAAACPRKHEVPAPCKAARLTRERLVYYRWFWRGLGAAMHETWAIERRYAAWSEALCADPAISAARSGDAIALHERIAAVTYRFAEALMPSRQAEAERYVRARLAAIDRAIATVCRDRGCPSFPWGSEDLAGDTRFPARLRACVRSFAAVRQTNVALCPQEPVGALLDPAAPGEGRADCLGLTFRARGELVTFALGAKGDRRPPTVEDAVDFCFGETFDPSLAPEDVIRAAVGLAPEDRARMECLRSSSEDAVERCLGLLAADGPVLARKFCPIDCPPDSLPGLSRQLETNACSCVPRAYVDPAFREHVRKRRECAVMRCDREGLNCQCQRAQEQPADRPPRPGNSTGQAGPPPPSCDDPDRHERECGVGPSRSGCIFFTPRPDEAGLSGWACPSQHCGCGDLCVGPALGAPGLCRGERGLLGTWIADGSIVVREGTWPPP